jgi:hypothetical protein
MARRKDLTALAALGTLGYMLSKKGDKGDEKQATTTAAAERRIAADKEASEEPKVIGSEAGMDPEEAANKRTERMLTNPNAREFGEAGTSMTVSPTKKPVAPRRPVVKSRPMSAAAEAAMQEANVSPTTRAEYDVGISNVPRRNSYYKKGGSVKKMASGGMASSASKRADGIATKGKTKCKIY